MEKQVNALSLFAHQSVSLCKRSDDVFYSVLLHSFESKDEKKKSPLCSSDSFLTVKFLNMLSDGTCQSQSLSKEKLGFYTHSHTFVLAFNARIAGLFFPFRNESSDDSLAAVNFFFFAASKGIYGKQAQEEEERKFKFAEVDCWGKVRPQSSDISLLNEAERREELPTTKAKTIYIYLHVLFCSPYRSVGGCTSVSGSVPERLRNTESVETRGAAPGPEDIGENLCEEPLSFSGSLNTQMARMIRPLQMCRSPL